MTTRIPAIAPPTEPATFAAAAADALGSFVVVIGASNMSKVKLQEAIFPEVSLANLVMM